MRLERTAERLPLTALEGDHNLLNCPACGNEWLHINGVHVELGNTSLCEGKRALERCRTQPFGWGRGGSIRIALWCEEGHQTWIDLLEHKGHIYVERSRQQPDASVEEITEE